MHKCIQYQVDPDLLNAGIALERLPKRNIKLVPEGGVNFQEPGNLIPSDISYSNPRRSHREIEIQVSAQVYQQFVQGIPIKLHSRFANFIGKRFKITNKETGKYVLRILSEIVDDKGIWLK